MRSGIGNGAELVPAFGYGLGSAVFRVWGRGSQLVWGTSFGVTVRLVVNILS